MEMRYTDSFFNFMKVRQKPIKIFNKQNWTTSVWRKVLYYNYAIKYIYTKKSANMKHLNPKVGNDQSRCSKKPVSLTLVYGNIKQSTLSNIVYTRIDHDKKKNLFCCSCITDLFVCLVSLTY